MQAFRPASSMTSLRAACRTPTGCAPATTVAGLQQPSHLVSNLSRSEVSRLQRRLSTTCSAISRPSVFLFGFGGDDEDDDKCTVAKVQLGIFGNVSKFQNELERLSELYDTDDEDSLHFILQETVTMLMRNITAVGYGSTAGKMFDYLEEAEERFNSVSLEERAKFKDETYVNFDGRRKAAATYTPESGDGLDQWMCVTLLMAVDKPLKLPKINSVQDMKKALAGLAGISSEELLAFELLWTPQAKGDHYTKDELLMDYPTMALVQ